MSVTEVGAGRKTLVDTATRGGAAAGLRPAAGGGRRQVGQSLCSQQAREPSRRR